MLVLRQLEMTGFGPYADRQVVDLPETPGVTVVYGDNMSGKTTMLNAIRFAFFGKVLGHGGRRKSLVSLSNRDLAVEGKYGFDVTLTFDFEGESYTLNRTCVPKTRSTAPVNDEDFEVGVLIRWNSEHGSSVMGPDECDRLLKRVLPEEISRFFLFDGELLQEYEDLLYHDKEGAHISEAIERILGVPVLKHARGHARQLLQEAKTAVGREASKHENTRGIGETLKALGEQQAQHEGELARLRDQEADLNGQKRDLEEQLQTEGHAQALVAKRDTAQKRLEELDKEEKAATAELKSELAKAWRTLVRGPILVARQSARAEAQSRVEALLTTLRARAVETGHCETCDQDVPPETRARLRTSIPSEVDGQSQQDVVMAMARVNALDKIDVSDNYESVRRISDQLDGFKFERHNLTLEIEDVDEEFRAGNVDQDSVRNLGFRYSDTIGKLAAVGGAISKHEENIGEIETAIRQQQAKLKSIGSSDVEAVNARRDLLDKIVEVFDQAVARYKQRLRVRVQDAASRLFLCMTTEKRDFAGLQINEDYGLSIVHKDGELEGSRSAGAEHVVALSLMGALQENAPLQGPLVMDSSFARLDDGHTHNVIETLPKMSMQTVVLVFEKEAPRDLVRTILGPQLVREYELHRDTARRTSIRKVN